jgi:hypothetical protein
MSALALYLALGACAGLLAGLLGVGGGLVIVAALAALLPAQGVPADSVMHVALATSLTSIILTGLSSARAHHARGSVAWRSVAWLTPGLLLGGVLGAALAGQLSGEVLRIAVAIFCLLAAAQMSVGTPRPERVGNQPAVGVGMSAAGVGIGSLSALVGIGGGSLTVPLLVWLGLPPVRAVGTSSACGVAIGLASAIGYASLGPEPGTLPTGSVGYVYLPAAGGIALASIICAPLGAWLAHRLDGPSLKRIFALLLLAVGVSLLLGTH